MVLLVSCYPEINWLIMEFGPGEPLLKQTVRMENEMHSDDVPTSRRVKERDVEMNGVWMFVCIRCGYLVRSMMISKISEVLQTTPVISIFNIRIYSLPAYTSLSHFLS